MKARLTLIALLALAGGLTGAAQRQYTPEFYIGGHAGATLAKMTFSPSVPQSFLPGMMIGVTALYTEENHFGLIAELNFEQRGWKEKFEDSPYTYSRRLNYLQVPLMTHIYFGNRKIRGFFNAGPVVGVMIGSSTSANFDYHDIGSIADFPTRNRENRQLDMAITSRFDYGLCGGVGMELFVKGVHAVEIEGRFYYGLGNIFPSAKKDVFGASRGMSIEIMAGYRFRLK